MCPIPLAEDLLVVVFLVLAWQDVEPALSNRDGASHAAPYGNIRPIVEVFVEEL